MDEARRRQVEERHRATLAAFVLRARRVEGHSLAADKVALHKLSSKEFTVEFKKGEASYLIQKLPPEEQIESAAARIRPLILQDDPVHYSKVLSALGYFTKDSPDDSLRNSVAGLRRDWVRIQPKGTNVLGSRVQIQDAEGNQSEFLSDTELAFAYIYGDVVHHDADRLARTKMHGVQERFKAAAPIVGFIMVLTIGTLNLTRKARTAGLLDLPDSLFEEEVVVKNTVFRNETTVWMAPVGTLPPRFHPSESEPATPAAP